VNASSLIDTLRAHGKSLCVAESLTGGALASALVDVAGASEVFLGGVVSYTITSKRDVLGISEEVLAHGVVSQEVAIAMARCARALFNSDYAISTTGVAGPGPQDGVEPGTVWVGFASNTSSEAVLIKLDGDRNQIRAAAVIAALELVDSQEAFTRLHHSK